jgi:enoyl-CoA hydratase/carnithine racemase
LPELTLGVIPGFGGMDISVPEQRTISTVTWHRIGFYHVLELTVLTYYLGTQRLPRLVGLPKAIEMVLVSN